ncbi:MAG TPA: hypothetical protein VNB95_00990 [Nitrososphaera sp.]|nr:hypothetical protein [Nitrososphaera sp.]
MESKIAVKIFFLYQSKKFPETDKAESEKVAGKTINICRCCNIRALGCNSSGSSFGGYASSPL